MVAVVIIVLIVVVVVVVVVIALAVAVAVRTKLADAVPVAPFPPADHAGIVRYPRCVYECCGCRHLALVKRMTVTSSRP